MKTAVPHRRSQAFSLVDCLVYIALFGLVTGLATSCAFKLERQSRELRQRSEEISRAMKAGERWRADIRSATNTPTLATPAAGRTLLSIPVQEGVVSYIFEGSNVWRKPAGSPSFGLFLPSVKQCLFLEDRRKNASGWICEMELATRRKQGKMPPLFSFKAVAPNSEQ